MAYVTCGSRLNLRLRFWVLGSVYSPRSSFSTRSFIFLFFLFFLSFFFLVFLFLSFFFLVRRGRCVRKGDEATSTPTVTVAAKGGGGSGGRRFGVWGWRWGQREGKFSGEKRETRILGLGGRARFHRYAIRSATFASSPRPHPSTLGPCPPRPRHSRFPLPRMYIASRRVESAVGWCSRARIFYVRTCTFLVSRNRLDSDFFRDRVSVRIIIATVTTYNFFFSSYISLSISTFVSRTNATRLSAIMIRRPPTSDVRSRFSYAACEMRTRWHRNRSGHWSLATGYWPLASRLRPSPRPKPSDTTRRPTPRCRPGRRFVATLDRRRWLWCAPLPLPLPHVASRRVVPFGVGPRGSGRLLHSLWRFFCDARRALRSRVAARPAESMRSRSLPRARTAQVVAASRRCRVSSDATRRFAEVSCSGRRFRTFVVRLSHFVRAHIIRRLRPVTFSTAGIWPSLTTLYATSVCVLYAGRHSPVGT